MDRHHRVRRSRRGDQRGAAAVEFALVAPLVPDPLRHPPVRPLLLRHHGHPQRGPRGRPASASSRRFSACGGQTNSQAKLRCTTKSADRPAHRPNAVKVTRRQGWVKGKPLVVCAMVRSNGRGRAAADARRRTDHRQDPDVDRAGHLPPTSLTSEDAALTGANWAWCSTWAAPQDRLDERPAGTSAAPSRSWSRSMAVALFLVAAIVVDLGLARDTERSRRTPPMLRPSPPPTCSTRHPGMQRLLPTPCIQDAVAAAKRVRQGQLRSHRRPVGRCPSAPTGYTVAPGDSERASPSTASPSRLAVDHHADPRHRDHVRCWQGSTDPGRHPSPGSGRRRPEGQLLPCFLGDLDSGNADYTVERRIDRRRGERLARAERQRRGHRWRHGRSRGERQPNGSFSPKPVIDIEPFTDPLIGLPLPVGKADSRSSRSPARPPARKVRPPPVTDRVSTATSPSPGTVRWSRACTSSSGSGA